MAWPSEAGSIAFVQALSRQRMKAVRPRSRHLGRRLRCLGTRLALKRHRNSIEATATVDFTPTANTLYHWYVDGVYVGATASARRTFHGTPSQSSLVCFASNEPDFDADKYAPMGHPQTTIITWYRSTSTDVAMYRIEHKIGAAASWSPMSVVMAEPGLWFYRHKTMPLTFDTTTRFRVVAIDHAGNESACSQVLWYPLCASDAPDWTYTFDDGTQKITFSES